MEEEAFLSSPAGHACSPRSVCPRMIRVAVAQTMITEPKILLNGPLVSAASRHCRDRPGRQGFIVMRGASPPRRKTVHFSTWMIPIFLVPVLFAAAMILFNLREAANADRIRRQFADDDIKAINAGTPEQK
jgi:hypothetical protein